MNRRKLKPISSESLKALALGWKTGKTSRYRMRCHAIYLMHSQKKGLNDIVALYKVDRDTASRWLNRYEAEGIRGLLDRPKTGRPINNKESLLKKI